MKDRDGYGIVPGCLVARYDSPRKHKGWVLEVDEGQGVVKVEHATRGGFRRWRVDDVHVVKPDDMDRARREGTRKNQAALVGGNPKRRKGL